MNVEYYMPNRSFRPLAGIMVLIEGFIYDIYTTTIVEFPSPCGDYGSYLCVGLKINGDEFI